MSNLRFSAASEYLELSISFRVLDHKVNSSSSPSFSINSAKGLFDSILSSASSSFDNRIIASRSWILLSKVEEEEAEKIIELNNPLAELIEKDGEEEEFTLWSNTLKLIDNSRYSEAAENLRFLILSYPKGAYLVDSYFWLAEIYFLQEMNEDAYETYFSLINNFPEHDRVPVSLYKLGLISIKLEKNDEAIAFFEQVILNYPDSGSSILSEQELLKFKS